MGSVRAKSLALFMINYSKGFEEISVQKINSEEIENFEFGYLFSKPQKDNPSENFIPIIEERIIKNDGIIQFRLLTKLKRPQNYSSLLNEERKYLFITSEMVNLYDGNYESEELILELRREEIVKAEKRFVESLDIFYNEPLYF
jgi:hypothetical protein